MRQVTVDTRPCSYSVLYGSADKGPAVLFVHGSGGDSTVWKRMFARAPVWTGRAVCVDLPGHGGSPGPAFDSVGDAAQWLGRFVETLGLGPCVLAGHSLGGAVAIRCASDFPDSACGLVCMSTGTQLPVPEGYMDVLSRDFAGAVCHSCASAYGASAPDALIRQGCDMLYRNGQETLCRDLRACAGFDGTAPAASLSAPALVLCGSDDALTPPDLSRDLCGRLPRAQLALVEGAGHMLMQEKPAECRSLIAGFVAGLLWAGSEVARV